MYVCDECGQRVEDKTTAEEQEAVNPDCHFEFYKDYELGERDGVEKAAKIVLAWFGNPARHSLADQIMNIIDPHAVAKRELENLPVGSIVKTADKKYFQYDGEGHWLVFGANLSFLTSALVHPVEVLEKGK